VKVKTSELTGIALDWAVAKCRGLTPTLHKNPYGYWVMPNIEGSYSSEWRHGGPIIERERISISDGREFPLWTAWLAWGNRYTGKTPLTAAMRCFVASSLGDEVDIPEELLE
jgi:hypothetical protein